LTLGKRGLHDEKKCAELNFLARSSLTCEDIICVASLVIQVAEGLYFVHIVVAFPVSYSGNHGQTGT
jgi:hypothetical protein